MSSTQAITFLVVAAVYLVLLGALLHDRRVLKARTDAAEGRVAGLTLDLDATRAKLLDVQAYLAQPDHWDVDQPAIAPARLRDPRPPSRWTTPPAPQIARSIADRATIADASVRADRPHSSNGPSPV